MTKEFPQFSGGKLLTALIIAGTIGLITAVTANGISLAGIKANRFTSNDGLEIWKQIAAIREDIAAMRWLPERFDRLEIKIDEAVKKMSNPCP